MGNPFFNRFGANNGGQLPGFLGNIQNAVNQFRQFRTQFQGNPEEQVKQLLNSGQMTQEQFNQLSILANQFQSFLK